MFDVPEPIPADTLLTLTLSVLCLQGTRNKEERELNTRVQSKSLNIFLLQRKKSLLPEPGLPLGGSGLDGFTG